MADGDVCVAQVEHDWVVTIEGPSGLTLTYGTRRDAVEAGRRMALSHSSRLRLNLDASSLAVEARTDEQPIAA